MYANSATGVGTAREIVIVLRVLNEFKDELLDDELKVWIGNEKLLFTAKIQLEVATRKSSQE